MLGRHEVLENRLDWLDIKKLVGRKIWKSRQWKDVAVHFIVAKDIKPEKDMAKYAFQEATMAAE